MEAGWCAILRLPRLRRRGIWPGSYCESAGVVVHPGSFYGIAEQGRVVVSLIGPVDEFAEGMERIAACCRWNQVS